MTVDKTRLIDTIALLQVPGVGRGRFGQLVSRFGSLGAVFGASIDELETVSGISRTIASAIKNDVNPTRAGETATRIERLGWAVLFQDSPEYPKRLLTLADAPVILFRLGEAFREDDKLIAIVGTRHPTERGRHFTHGLAAEMARQGLTVVSGMADGIDSFAHKGALEGGGKTVAVWGTPLDVIYPNTNRALAKLIAERGAVYSEYLPGVEVSPAFFSERNRIISGLSEAVIVVEAGIKSGALITAADAIDQGRDLFAVPGAPWIEQSIGTNGLIKRGARLLTGIQDLFEELPRLKGEVTVRRFQQLTELTDAESQLIELLTGGPQQIDYLSRTSGFAMNELMEYLLALELKGLVQELSGKRYMLAE